MLWVILVIAVIVVAFVFVVGVLPILLGPKHLSVTQRSELFREVVDMQREKREQERTSSHDE